MLGLAHRVEVTEGVGWVCWGGVTLQQSRLACLRARGNPGHGKLGHVGLWLLTGKLGTRQGEEGPVESRTWP